MLHLRPLPNFADGVAHFPELWASYSKGPCSNFPFAAVFAFGSCRVEVARGFRSLAKCGGSTESAQLATRMMSPMRALTRHGDDPFACEVSANVPLEDACSRTSRRRTRASTASRDLQRTELGRRCRRSLPEDLSHQFIIQGRRDAPNFHGDNGDVLDMSVSYGHCRRWHRRLMFVWAEVPRGAILPMVHE